MEPENLTAALEDPDEPVHMKVSYIIGSALNEGMKVLPVLQRYKHHQDSNIRSAVAMGMGFIGRDYGSGHVYDDLLQIAEKDPEELIRGDAIIALGDTKDSRALDYVTGIYPSLPTRIKNRVLYAIQKLETDSALPFLEQIVSENEMHFLAEHAKRIIQELKRDKPG